MNSATQIFLEEVETPCPLWDKTKTYRVFGRVQSFDRNFGTGWCEPLKPNAARRNVHFKLVHFVAARQWHLGPIELGNEHEDDGGRSTVFGGTPTSVREGTILYGVAKYQADFQSFGFLACVVAPSLYKLCRALTAPLATADTVVRALNASQSNAASVPNMVTDTITDTDSLSTQTAKLVAQLLLHDIAGILATPRAQWPKIGLVPFAASLAIFCRTSSVYHVFANYARAHPQPLRPHELKQVDVHAKRITPSNLQRFCAVAAETTMRPERPIQRLDDSDSDWSC